jgi:hypothetical protein
MLQINQKIMLRRSQLLLLQKLEQRKKVAPNISFISGVEE